MKLVRAEVQPAEPRNEPDPALAYTFHWTRKVRQWEPDRRRVALQGVEAVLEAEDFRANLYRRVYHIPEVDEERHAGASVMALHKVLRAFEDNQDSATAPGPGGENASD